jgi:hypothetical protein
MSTGQVVFGGPGVGGSGGAVSSVAGIGGSFPGLDWGVGALTNSAQVTSASNIVDAFQFIQKYTQSIGHISIRVTTTFGASSHIGVGIYSSSGILLASTGALDGTNVSTTQMATLATAVVLTPGIYWLGVSSDGATTGRAYAYQFTLSIAAVTQFINNANGNRLVTGSSASVGGVPPSTLGTLSANSTTSPILAFMEP